tara:strand:+ start:427 stop:774 length:348 start_codon:yes stop_codon:yes gene_type:complete
MNYLIIKKIMKFNKNLIIILAFVTLISSCGSVRESLSGGKQDNYDEFTVKNKDPLIIPPNFDDLPEPEGVGVNNKSESVNLDFSDILKSSKTEKQTTKTKKGSLEKSISKILNSN